MKKNPVVMRSPKRVLRTLALLGGLGTPQVVLAQSPPTQLAQPSPLPPVPAIGCPETPDAAKLFELGIALLGHDLNREALGAFQRSYNLSHCPRALAQLAFVEKGLQRWADASTHLRSALSSTDPWIEEGRSQFQQELTKIDERLSLAEGRNEDPELALKPAPKMPMRTRAGWGLLVSGALVGGAGVAGMSVAQAFSGSVTGIDFGLWENGDNVYRRALLVGGVLAGVGAVGVITGATLLLRPAKEANQISHLWVAPAPNGLAIGGAF